MGHFVGLTVGRIVHFYTKEDKRINAPTSNGEGPYAAVVAGVREDGKADLYVMPVEGWFGAKDVPPKDNRGEEPSWWEWPPRTA